MTIASIMERMSRMTWACCLPLVAMVFHRVCLCGSAALPRLPRLPRLRDSVGTLLQDGLGTALYGMALSKENGVSFTYWAECV